MPFKLTFSKEALSQLRKMENSVVKRIFAKLESTAERPANFFNRLAGREDYKLRVGDYRVVAKILHHEKRIFVFSLGHRKNIYKRLKQK